MGKNEIICLNYLGKGIIYVLICKQSFFGAYVASKEPGQQVNPYILIMYVFFFVCVCVCVCVYQYRDQTWFFMYFCQVP